MAGINGNWLFSKKENLKINYFFQERAKEGYDKKRNLLCFQKKNINSLITPINSLICLIF